MTKPLSDGALQQAYELINRPISLHGVHEAFADKTDEEIEAMLEGDEALTFGSVTAPAEVWRAMWAYANGRG